MYKYRFKKYYADTRTYSEWYTVSANDLTEVANEIIKKYEIVDLPLNIAGVNYSVFTNADHVLMCGYYNDRKSCKSVLGDSADAPHWNFNHDFFTIEKLEDE